MKDKEIIKQNVGIDISKDDFAVAYVILTVAQKIVVKGTRKFSNTPKGFAEFITWVDKFNKEGLEINFTMEATGVYYENLAYYLFEHGYTVHVVLPNKAKKYAESLDIKSKTDKLDSKSLGRLGAERALEKWQVSSPQFKELRDLTRERDWLNVEKTAVSNRLHALEHTALPPQQTIERCQQRIQLCKSQIKEVDTQIKASLEKDPELKAKVEKLVTIPGVGLLTAVTILGETNGFAMIKNNRQLTSYAGLDVVLKESGTFKGKTKISKKGNSYIRKILYFPALTTVKGTGSFKEVYERIVSQKHKPMIAVTAIQRKLLVLIYSLWKTGAEFDPAYGQEKTMKKSSVNFGE
jgi:transposase